MKHAIGTISVIIPVYNTEAYLEKCLTSVCNQTYKALEIIIVNDESPDNSSAIIKKFSDSDDRIIVVEQKNQGVSAARNSALKLASGEYVMFVDSDDWLDLNACEKAVEIALQYKTDMVMWPYKREYENNAIDCMLFNESLVKWNETNIHELYRRFIGLVNEELAEPQKNDSVITVWGKLYRRDVVSNTFFVDIKDIGIEDLWFNLQAFSEIKSAVYFSDVFYHYRKDNTTSLTKNYKKELISRWKNLYDRIDRLLRANNERPVFFEALSNRICLGLIGLCLNLEEDEKIKSKDKIAELNRILSMPHYSEALEKLDMRFFPKHWKLFFTFAKRKKCFCLLSLLKVMNSLRNRK